MVLKTTASPALSQFNGDIMGEACQNKHLKYEDYVAKAFALLMEGKSYRSIAKLYGEDATKHALDRISHLSE